MVNAPTACIGCCVPKMHQSQKIGKPTAVGINVSSADGWAVLHGWAEG